MALQLDFKLANLHPAPYYILYVMPYWLWEGGGKVGGGFAAGRWRLLKTSHPTPNFVSEDQPRTSVPRLSLRLSVNPPGRGPLHEYDTSLKNSKSAIKLLQVVPPTEGKIIYNC